MQSIQSFPETARRTLSSLRQLQSIQSTATPMRASKEWRKELNPNARNIVVSKLVNIIIPNGSELCVLDPRINILVSWARKFETEMYEMADTSSDYYQSLAEKIYSIQKELGKYDYIKNISPI